MNAMNTFCNSGLARDLFKRRNAAVIWNILDKGPPREPIEYSRTETSLSGYSLVSDSEEISVR